jgi:3-dehydroquinate synthase
MHKISVIASAELIENIENLSDRDFIIIDQHVASLYQNLLTHKNIIQIPNPEENKNLDSYEKIVIDLIERGAQRTTRILAIGGGALTDLASFVASTLFRGVQLTLVPTTLLGMIDASVGGKTAINTTHGKNLLGSFYPAEEILIDFNFLQTLSEREVLCGKGELLKYTFLSDKIYKLVINGAAMDDIILACIDYKISICNKDLREAGQRKLLNFGHSFGHAIEFIDKLSHGLAVVNGIHIILSIFNDQLLSEFTKLLDILEIDHSILVERKSEYSDLLKYDKKNISSFIQVVTIDEIGKPNIIEVKLEELIEKYNSL